MTQPTPSNPFPVPYPTSPRTFPATQTLTVDDPLCGHLPDERHDDECDYWRGVALGEYPAPDGMPGPYALPGHLPGLLPLTDPALGGVPC